ncbi:MAG TPA: DUF2807 domain-containing protein [Caulobacteraceae bacterium]
MKSAIIVAMSALAAAGAAQAAQVDIRHAAARVTVIPEARSDIAVSIVRGNPRLRLNVTQLGDRVIVNGGLGFFGPNCTHRFGVRGVTVWGMGFIPYDQLPQIVVRTPLDAKVSAGGAVYGAVDRSRSLDLSNAGCGDWTVANVAGPADLHMAGSGDVRGGSVGHAEVNISGSADVMLRTVNNGLDSHISGSGDVKVDAVNGPLSAKIAGSGDVVIAAGSVSHMEVGVAGSGDVRFGGTAGSLNADVAGSGDVTVGHVRGPVSKHVAGSGTVTVGP